MSVLYTLYILLIFFIPIMLGHHLVVNWMRYLQRRSFFGQDYVVLELFLPKEITRSPVGMEIFFTAMHQTGAASYHEVYVQGKIRPTFSFELVSDGGKVHFYIWTRKNWRNNIEAQIYAQYPNVEIKEVEDYTGSFYHDPAKNAMWGTTFIYSKPNSYPLKTYIDYGLDKDPKEEFKIDPMTSVLEYLGSLKAGEKTWIQIIIQAHKKEGLQEGRLVKRPDWKDEITGEIKKIREKTLGGTGDIKLPNPTRGESDVIAALERSYSKFAFEVVLRGIYMSDKEIFNANLGISGLIGSFRQYNSLNMNGIKLGKFTDFGDTGKDIISMFGWITPLRVMMRQMRDQKEIRFLDLYKQRYAFLEPKSEYNPKPLIMTTEELATIYHFPGQVATTPTMARTNSKKAEPPPNLPI